MPIFLLLAALLLVGGVAAVKVIGKSPSVLRSTEELEPLFRAKFLAFLAAAKATGKPLIVAETYRSPERQAWLYGSSRASYVYNGVEYGKPAGPWLTDRSPEHPSEHQKRQAADTIPGNGIKADSAEAVAYLRSLESLAKTFGLKNLPSKSDFGHWENA